MSRFMQVRFSDPQSASISRQSLLDHKVEANFVKKVSKAVKVSRVRPSSIFHNLKPKTSQSDFGDANIELTLNLLKIRPEEEVRGRSQSNSAFFDELNSTSRMQHNQNISTMRSNMLKSDMSSDSINPSLEMAYSMMDQGPYSDPGLSIGFFQPAPHFGAMNV